MIGPWTPCGPGRSGRRPGVRDPIAVTGPRDLVAIARPEGGTRVSWQILWARDEVPAATS